MLRQLRTNVLAAALLWGCTVSPRLDVRESANSAAWIQEAGPRVVHETEEFPLGGLLFAARGSQGMTFVSDGEHARVVAIDSSGVPRLLFGRRGTGPGEFQSGGAIAMLSGDSVVGVVDGRLRRLYAYDLRQDSVQQVIRLPWASVGSSWNVVGDSMAVALTASVNLMTVGNWRAASLSMLGVASPRVGTDMFAVLQHGRPEIVRWKDGYLGVFAAEDGLHVLDASASRTGVVRLPARARRGIPDDLFKETQRRSYDRSSTKSIEPVGSMVMGLHRLTSGHVVIVYMDVDQAQRATPEAPVRGVYSNYRYFVSLVTPELDRACVDAEIRLPTDIPPVPFFRGDSMFVIEKRVLSNDSVRTVLRKWVVNPSACISEPTGGITMVDAK